MPLPKQVTAPTYVQAHAILVELATRSGKVETPDGKQPALTNGQAVAVIYGWQYAAQRSGVVVWEDWYPLALRALGWRKLEDKFRVDLEHRGSPFDPETLPRLWSSSKKLAEDLDAAKVRVGPIYLPQGKEQFRVVAQWAWERLKKEHPELITKPPLPELPELPVPPTPTLPPPDKIPKPPLPLPPPNDSGGGDWGWLLLAGAALFLSGGRNRDSRRR